MRVDYILTSAENSYRSRCVRLGSQNRGWCHVKTGLTLDPVMLHLLSTGLGFDVKACESRLIVRIGSVCDRLMPTESLQWPVWYIIKEGW